MTRFHLILIFIISFILIFYQFNQIPKNLDKDEVEFAKLALSLDKKPYIPYSPLATGHSTLYFYIILFSFKLFGISNFSLRFPSAFFGLLSPIVFYLILSLSFKLLKIKNHLFFALLGSIIFLTSRWYFNFARFSYETTFLLFLELSSIYFLLQWLIKKQNLFLILSGLFAGLAFNSYTPGRIFFLLPLSFLTYQLINPLTCKQDNKLKLLYFLIPFIITIMPLSLYFLKNKDIRFEQQFFLSNSDLNLNEKISFLWQNTKSNILMLFLKGDLNGRHNYPGKPALNPILVIFFILGLIAGFKKIKNPLILFWLIYFYISFLPTILTYPWENPNMLRTFTAIPSICFFLILGIYQVLKVINNKGKFFRYFLFLLLFLSSIYEIRTYFKYQSQVFDSAFKIKNKLNKIIKNYD